ncbi:hypothetical protein AVEN_97655-1 [Araneus ventricosus]|uniref:Uncharacterized protein n=1 Tax=Araneus ventricosus TaxID=182803 RepID=A0A4Y2GVJ2_ARAVE|nr:hypothetical protein AVEN_97655-1 [Araneus ventricosus]
MPNAADIRLSESSNSSAGVSAVAIKYQLSGATNQSCDLVLNPPQTDSYNNLKARLIAQNADSESVRLKKLLSVQGDSPYVKLLLKFSDITKSSQPKPAVQVKHNTEHHIETRDPPVFSKARRLDPEKLQASKREFQYMVS